MNQRKIISSPSGHLTFDLHYFWHFIVAAVLCFVTPIFIWGGAILVLNFFPVLPGLIINNPNESKLPTLFIKQVAQLKQT